MLKLKRRGDVWQITGTLPDGRRIRQSTGTGDKALAERILAKSYLTQVEMGHGLTPTSLSDRTLEEAYKHAWAVHPGWRDAKGPQTIEYNWAHVRDHFGATRLLRTIAQADVDGFSQSLACSASTHNSIMGVLAVILRYSEASSQPGLKMRLRKRRDGRIRYLSDEEELAVLAHFRHKGDHEMADLVAVLLDTGCRLSEVLKLSQTCVRGDLLHVWEAKNGKSRTLPLAERSKAILEARRGILGGPFAGLSRFAADSRWSAMRKALGLEQDKEFVIHALRHTKATRLALAGHNVAAIKAWMGHESIQTTMRYTHIDTTQLRALADTSQGCVRSVPNTGTMGGLKG